MLPNYDLLKVLPVALYVTDAEGTITFYNEAAAEMWGQRPEPGMKWCGSWKLYRTDGSPLPHDECPMAVTVKTGEPVRSAQAVLQRPNGERIAFQPMPTPIRDENGKLIGAVNMLFDLKDRHQAMEQSERLAAIVSSSDDAIVSKTLEGRITSWNAGAERIFGYSSEEMIGENIRRIIPGELQHEENEIIAKLSRGERVDHFETVRVTKDGRHIDLSITVSPMRDATGRITGASKVARDISERKRAEEMQRLLVDELHHRIKNTLATVQAIASQTLRRNSRPDVFVSSFNGRIQALARAHALLTANTFRGADLAQLIRDQLLLGDANDNRIAFSGPGVTLEAQAALHVALVLHELGTNARKYGALSTPTGAVTINWELHTNGGNTLTLTWRESGGPKVRAPTSRGFGSTLIEESLKAHGGEVSTRFAEDGITCSITMPLAQLKNEHVGSATPFAAKLSSRDETAASRLQGKRVLVIEDEALIAMVLGDYLEQFGCVLVGPAHSLEKARALIESKDFDAALVDANLAGKRVDELALALTQKNVPFAFVTGYGRDALPQGFHNAVAVDKPFTPDQVRNALEHLLSPDGNVVPLKYKKS